MAPSGWFETYSRAAQNSFKVWPLFLVKLFFLILQSVTLVFCLSFMFGPFVTRNFQDLMNGLQDPETHDWTGIAADWLKMVSDPSWIGIFLGLGLLYATWWCFLSALEDGGVYGTLLDLVEEGKAFSIVRFFQWAFRTFLPMVGLQVYLGIWVLIPFFSLALILLAVLALLTFMGPSWGLMLGLGVIVGLPLFLLGVLFGFAFLAFGFLARAYVVKGERPGTAMRKAFDKFRAERGRVGVGLMVPLVIYFAANFLLRILTLVLGVLPVLDRKSVV